MRHTLWTGISETNVNFITSATRIHAFNNNKVKCTLASAKMDFHGIETWVQNYFGFFNIIFHTAHNKYIYNKMIG